jgi:hypothetical protein
LSEPAPEFEPGSSSGPEPATTRLGRTPGMKPVHAVVAVAFALFWVGVLAFVLVDGRDDGSSVDVYSELPPGFTAALREKGVTYAGLSPVDSSTVEQVLAHAPSGAATSGVEPIVLRTAFTDAADGYQSRAALMVVVPQAASPADGSVYVAFLDPTSYQVLASLTYGGAGASR